MLDKYACPQPPDHSIVQLRVTTVRDAVLSRPRIGATCLPWVATRNWTMECMVWWLRTGVPVQHSTSALNIVQKTGRSVEPTVPIGSVADRIICHNW